MPLEEEIYFLLILVARLCHEKAAEESMGIKAA